MRDEDEGARLVVVCPGVTTADVVAEARRADAWLRRLEARGVTRMDATQQEREREQRRDLEAHRQEVAGRLVEQNVYLCMSAWVDAMINAGDGNEEAREHYYGDQAPDWDAVREALAYEGVYVVEWHDDADEDAGTPGTFADADGDPFDLVEHGKVSAEDAADLRQEAARTMTAGWYILSGGSFTGECYDDAETATREAADEARIDLQDHVSDIYEWWAVDSWFGRKLAERGEHVVEGEHGGSMWGRTCTGQAIKLDSVVRRIAADLWPEEWAGGPTR